MFAGCVIKFAAGVIVLPNVFIADIADIYHVLLLTAVFDLADVLAVALCCSYCSCRCVSLFCCYRFSSLLTNVLLMMLHLFLSALLCSAYSRVAECGVPLVLTAGLFLIDRLY